MLFFCGSCDVLRGNASSQFGRNGATGQQLCATKKPGKLKTKIYKTAVRPVLKHGAVTWTISRNEERVPENVCENAEMECGNIYDGQQR